jgi:hypothetical protein
MREPGDCHKYWGTYVPPQKILISSETREVVVTRTNANPALLLRFSKPDVYHILRGCAHFEA